jgi:hypothetical protein
MLIRPLKFKHVLFDTQKNSTCLNNTELKTVRLSIDDTNRAELPSPALGDIVWNTALIIDTIDSYIIEEEVTVQTDGTYVLFDDADDVKNKYCIVSYLTKGLTT